VSPDVFFPPSPQQRAKREKEVFWGYPGKRQLLFAILLKNRYIDA